MFDRIKKQTNKQTKRLKKIQEGIRNTVKYRSIFPEQIPDTAVYFLDKIDEIASDDYVPSFEDYVQFRRRTSGAQIVNIEIDLDKISGNTDGKKIGVFNFEFTDIGGQAADRNKWARVMNDQISVVLFVCAVAEYDLPCYEDIVKRRMADALDAFRKLMTHNLGRAKFVENKHVFVLFNKFGLYLCFVFLSVYFSWLCFVLFCSVLLHGLKYLPKTKIYETNTCDCIGCF